MSSLIRFLVALGLTTTLAASQSAPIPPSRDPWYTAPAGFESTAPGTVLRVRSAPGNLPSLYTNSANAHNILFRTTDNANRPTFAVTTVFAPKQVSHNTTTTTSIITYQIPLDTPDLDAGSPSYQLYNQSFFGDGGNAIFSQDIQSYLANGWFVNAPDFEGPHGTFSSELTAGQALLDSIRATLSLRESHKTATWAPSRNDTSVAFYGFSGGALASEFAVELAPKYAPELCGNIVGAALNSLVGNITHTFTNVAAGSVLAGLIPSAMVGFGKAHPQFNETLLKSLKPENESQFLSVENLYFDDIIGNFAKQNINTYFKSGSIDTILREPSFIQAVNEDAVAGKHGVPKVPIWSFQAVQDEVSDINQTKALYSRYCDAGASVLLEVNSVGFHVDSQTNGAKPALMWLEQVLGGTYKVKKGCQFEDVTVQAGPSKGF